MGEEGNQEGKVYTCSREDRGGRRGGGGDIGSSKERENMSKVGW